MGKKKKKENIENTEVTENIETPEVSENSENDSESKSTILAVPENTSIEDNQSESSENQIESENPETSEEKTEEIQQENSNTDIIENQDTSINEVSDTPSEKRNNKKMLMIIIPIVIAIILVLLLLFFSTIFALVNKNNTNILNGTYINNINVSNMTRDDALSTLLADEANTLKKAITLKHNDYEAQVSLTQIELTFDNDTALNQAYSKGRSGNIFKDNYDILFSSFTKDYISIDFSYNEENINSLVKEIEVNLSDRLIETSYYIDGNNLIISKGKNGYVIDTIALNENIKLKLIDIDTSNCIIEIPVIYKEIDNIDINKIHSEIYKTPTNAYFTKDPYVIYPHVDGIDFAISIEEAQNLVNNSQEEEISIPLNVTSPQVTTSDIGNEAFPDQLSTYYTTYSTNNVNRSTNIRLASDKVNGTVVMPGEVFSYNATVGQRTSAAGFMPAPVYSGGEVTTGLGGGICQVSSTLYNAVLLANLEIEERQNHGFNPGYVPVGRDATVSWGAPDFKFRNTRNYPIKIVCDGSGGTINVDILGLKEKDEYDIDIESYVTSWIAYSTITRNDPNLEPGETKVIQSGSSGCRSVAYRVFYKDGEEIDRELLSQDTYSPHNKIVAVGN